MNRHRTSRHQMRRNARRMRRYGVEPVAMITDDLEFAPLIIAGIARAVWRYRSELAPLTVAGTDLAAGAILHNWYPTWWPTIAAATTVVAGALTVWGRWVNLTRPI
jgi:hypothetical protein